jgi:5-methyltetrahydrofolate--homocysteine methyltransferase
MMKATIEDLVAGGVRDRVKVIVGGAPITPEYAQAIGADGFAPNAHEAVELARRLLGR